MDVSTLEGWLWDAACQIRGAVDAPKFKDFILPLIFLKRLSDVFEDEVGKLAEELGDKEFAEQVVDEGRGYVRFYVPGEARWPAISTKTTGLGEHLTTAVKAVARENPKLQGVIDVVDFNARTAGQRIVDDPALTSLVRVLGKHRLGVGDVEPDILGRAYEYLLRKFAEGQGQSAGEFYTPREVGVLIADLLNPEPGMEVYDPCCGSAGLLIKCHLRLVEEHGEQRNGRKVLPESLAPMKLYGQEINGSTFAMARMNAFLHEMEAEVALGDTMRRPAFSEGGRPKRFDLVAANPMWNQKFPTELYEHDPYERFGHGTPPGSSADWGWLQHMVGSLEDGGRMAVVLDTGAVSRGSGNTGSNRERDLRKTFVEGNLTHGGDLVEAVVLLPENLFYNTTAPGIVLVVNKQKRHPGEILLVNASKLFEKGRPKNHMTAEHVGQVALLYREWRAEEGVSAVITTEEAARNDYNLSPSRYVSGAEEEDFLPVEVAVVLLLVGEVERGVGDRYLTSVRARLGL
ncbi:MAG: N-6 DNA methylase [Rubrobacter sp.]